MGIEGGTAAVQVRLRSKCRIVCTTTCCVADALFSSLVFARKNCSATEVFLSMTYCSAKNIHPDVSNAVADTERGSLAVQWVSTFPRTQSAKARRLSGSVEVLQACEACNRSR